MTDIFTKQKRSEVMAAIRSKDTRPEVAVRSMLHRMGLRFRIHGKRLPGTPDVVLARHKTVVEVLGCFWHRHPRCKLASNPSSNRAFWQAKFSGNVARDAANRKALRKMGWRTVVVWECELRKPDRLERRLRKAFGIGGHPSVAELDAEVRLRQTSRHPPKPAQRVRSSRPT